jgi:transcriptional regulator with XRE-family HTH domain
MKKKGGNVFHIFLGPRILFFRNQIDLKQIQLARALGYKSTGTISRIEKGQIGMTQEKLLQAAKILNVHPFVLQTPVDLSFEKLILLSKFMTILERSDDFTNYEAIKTLIEK